MSRLPLQPHDPKALQLRQTMQSFAEISDATWRALLAACSTQTLKRHETLIQTGLVSSRFYFVCKGLFRTFTVSEDGKEYTKHFFPEYTFPGSIRSLLTGEPSTFTVQALEDSVVIAIDHGAYRQLLERHDDLKWYHIQYLEKNWVLAKEPIEVSFAIEDASTRYENFLATYPNLVSRLSLQNIASRLGITPTQLSRIRKSRGVSPDPRLSDKK